MVATRRSNSVDSSSVLQEKSSGEKNAANSSAVSKTRVRRMVSSGTKRNIFMDHSDEIDQVHQSSRRPRTTARPISPSSEDDDHDTPVSRSTRTRSSRSLRYHSHRISPRRSSRDISSGRGLRRSSRRRKSHYPTLDEDMATLELLPGEVFEGETHPVEKTQGETRAKRAELRDLLAMQGKDLSDVQSYMEPDIYSSVKSRKRASTKNRLYGEYYTSTSQIRNRHDQDGEETQSSEEEEERREEDEHTNDEPEEEAEEGEEEEEEEEESENETEGEDGHKYSLRTVREAPQRYTIVQEAQPRRPRTLFEALPCSPVRRRRKKVSGSSDHNPYQKRRRRSRVQANSSTSTDSSSDDEIKFRKRQQRSMAKARNQCMPINMTSADIGNHSFARDRKKIGQSLADIDPMSLDTSVKFSSVGGHNKHIRALKEMIVFPLLYPEVFTKFHISPPRGCLFYGPPGTGKTLMARALANECSTEGKKVSFFMKKGADCLSKWIGESERQLRLLFDQAYQLRPSIIFFDEIDGLAPVRSTRQDQIHSSIVSTLLALMDGLDSRGEIVVIGATNRIDSIDPALRRPGRFDREFLFPLPDKKAREQILKIHTSAWDPQLKPSYVDYLATKTVGYCGADLKALCTEAALFALRRRYPQIYKSSDKLQLDVNSIKISGCDFLSAIKNIIPTAQRSASNHGRELHSTMKPLLGRTLLTIVSQLVKVFPVLNGKSKVLKETKTQNGGAPNDPPSDAESEVETSTYVDGIYVGEPDLSDRLTAVGPNISSTSNGIVQPQYATLMQRLSSVEHSLSTVHRPRFMICGDGSSGHISHLTPALIHDMEGIPIHTIDLPTLYGVSVRTPEESCAQVFREARRVTPSVIYLPNALQWWNVASPTVLATLESLLQDIPPRSPILLLATANCSYRQLPRELAKFFHSDFCEVYETSIQITTEQRRDFFAPIFLIHAVTPPPLSGRKTARMEVLVKAPAPKPAPLSEQEERKLEKDEESTLRNLRLFLRDVLMRLMRDRRFKIFSKPVDFEEVPDYMEVIKSPMDFSTILTKIDQHKYQTVENFLEHIDLICNNALEYNPDRRPEDKLIRHRACAMRDMAHAIVDQDLDPDFEKLCHDIVESRKRRGAEVNKYAPRYYPVLPKHLMIHPITGEVVPKTTEPSEAMKSPSAADEVMTEKTPWKLPPKKSPSTHRAKRKRSSWSRGVISSKRKKKSVIIEEEEEEKKEGESSEQEDDSHEELPLIDDDDDEAEGENEENGVVSASDESPGDVKNHVEEDDEEEENGEKKEEEEEEEEGEAPSEEQTSPESNDDIGEEGHFQGTENGGQTHVGRNLSNLFDQAHRMLKQKEHRRHSLSGGAENGDGEAETIVRNGFAGDVKEENMDENEVSSTSRGSTPPVATIYPDLDAANDDEVSEKNHDPEGNEEEETAESMEQGPGSKEATPRKMTLRSHDKPTSETNSGTKPAEEEPPPSPPPPFVVDHKVLMTLLEVVVVVTESFSVEELERVYSTLSRCVNKHRMSYDRTELQQDLKAEISTVSSLTAAGREDFSSVS